jgi:hypothetical protein
MIKGRLWRFLMLFLAIYVIFLLYFLRSFNSDTDETTSISPLSDANVKVLDLNDGKENKIPDKIVVQNVEKEDLSKLEPVMTKGVLGNYEPKNLVKSPGVGEDGAGVQLQENEKKKGEDSVAAYGFNEVASEKISLDRRARDTR